MKRKMNVEKTKTEKGKKPKESLSKNVEHIEPLRSKRIATRRQTQMVNEVEKAEKAMNENVGQQIEPLRSKRISKRKQTENVNEKVEKAQQATTKNKNAENVLTEKSNKSAKVLTKVAEQIDQQLPSKRIMTRKQTKAVDEVETVQKVQHKNAENVSKVAEQIEPLRSKRIASRNQTKPVDEVEKAQNWTDRNKIFKNIFRYKVSVQIEPLSSKRIAAPKQIETVNQSEKTQKEITKNAENVSKNSAEQIEPLRSKRIATRNQTKPVDEVERVEKVTNRNHEKNTDKNKNSAKSTNKNVFQIESIEPIKSTDLPSNSTDDCVITAIRPRRIIQTPIQLRDSKNSKESAFVYKATKSKCNKLPTLMPLLEIVDPNPVKGLHRLKSTEILNKTATKKEISSTPSTSTKINKKSPVKATKSNNIKSLFQKKAVVRLHRLKSIEVLNKTETKNEISSKPSTSANNNKKSPVKATESNNTKSPIQKKPIYTTIAQPNDDKTDDDAANIYDYSQDSIATNDKEDSMKPVIEKLRRERKIVLKRKPGKQKKQPNENDRIKPMWKDRRQNMKIKRGLREIKNSIKMVVQHEELVKKIKNRQEMIPKSTNEPTEKLNSNPNVNSSTEANSDKSDNANILAVASPSSDPLAVEHSDNDADNDCHDNDHGDDSRDSDSAHDFHKLSSSHKTYSRPHEKTTPKATDQSVIYRRTMKNLNFQSTPIQGIPVKLKSPWRMDNEIMPSVPYYATSTDHLPTYSSEIIAPAIQKPQSGAKWPDEQPNQTIESNENEQIPESNVNTINVLHSPSTSEASNVENIEPESYRREIEQNVVKHLAPIVEKRFGPRSPLKSLALINNLNQSQITIPSKHVIAMTKSPQKVAASAAAAIAIRQQLMPPPQPTTSSFNGIDDCFGFDCADANNKPNGSPQKTVPPVRHAECHKKNLKEKLESLRKYRSSGRPTRAKSQATNQVERCNVVTVPEEEPQPSTSKFAFGPTIGQQQQQQQQQTRIDDLLKQNVKMTEKSIAMETMDDLEGATIIDGPNEKRCSPVLFESFWGKNNDETLVPKTYSRASKRKRYQSTSYSDVDEDEHNDKAKESKKEKHKTKQQKKQDKELEKFAERMNSEFDEIEKFQLVVN